MEPDDLFEDIVEMSRLERMISDLGVGGKIDKSIMSAAAKAVEKEMDKSKPFSPSGFAEEKKQAEERAKARAEEAAKLRAETELKEKMEKDRIEALKLIELQKGYFGELVSRDDVLEEHTNFIPTIDPTYHFQPVTEEICYNLHSRKPILLIGHTGTGKTSLAEQVAARIGQPTIRANMNGQTSISDFVGFWGVKGAETYWVDGVLPFAMQKGLWLIVDELDCADAPILTVLNAVLERNGKLVLKEKGHEVITPHKNFRIIATANAAGRMAEYRSLYQGTNIMNEAFMDRFKCYVIDYMPDALEKKVLKAAYPALSEMLCHKLVELANNVRKAFLQETVQCTFSTRRLLDWAEDIVYFQSKKMKKPISKAAESTIFSKISKEDAAAIEGFMKRLIGPEDVAEHSVSFHDGEAPKKRMSFKDS